MEPNTVSSVACMQSQIGAEGFGVLSADPGVDARLAGLTFEVVDDGPCEVLNIPETMVPTFFIGGGDQDVTFVEADELPEPPTAPPEEKCHFGVGPLCGHPALAVGIPPLQSELGKWTQWYVRWEEFSSLAPFLDGEGAGSVGGKPVASEDEAEKSGSDSVPSVVSQYDSGSLGILLGALAVDSFSEDLGEAKAPEDCGILLGALVAAPASVDVHPDHLLGQEPLGKGEAHGICDQLGTMQARCEYFEAKVEGMESLIASLTEAQGLCLSDYEARLLTLCCENDRQAMQLEDFRSIQNRTAVGTRVEVASVRECKLGADIPGSFTAVSFAGEFGASYVGACAHTFEEKGLGGAHEGCPAGASFSEVPTFMPKVAVPGGDPTSATVEASDGAEEHVKVAPYVAREWCPLIAKWIGNFTGR